MTTLLTTTVPTHLGLMSLLGTEECLHVAAFGAGGEVLRPRLPVALQAAPIRSGEVAGTAALRAYFDGDLRALDTVAVRQDGGGFHRRVWQELRAVPAGSTISYTELAARSGGPRAVRAAASACARNAICLFVPCHRVVRSDGTLGGYYYGLDTKQRLLDHERLRH